MKLDKQTLFICAGIAGYVASVIDAAFATPKYLEYVSTDMEIVKERGQRSLGKKLAGYGSGDPAGDTVKINPETGNEILEAELVYEPTLWDKICVHAWAGVKAYWHVAILVVASGGAIVYANHLALSKLAATAAAYGWAMKQIQDKDSAIAGLLPEKASIIKDAAFKELDGIDIPERTVHHTNSGDQLFIDKGTGQCLTGSVAWVQEQFMDLVQHYTHELANGEIPDECVVTQADIIEKLGLQPVCGGNMLALTVDNKKKWLSLDKSFVTKSGETCIIIDYDLHPVDDWEDYSKPLVNYDL